ncbi:WhiB family transcriptional regulator [Streptomyces sp. NPDC096193]|uniref:WhiB family transcriptional regulator n=1 Tax=Streptomyces sp. NPDC096193 TaxID=3155821 RepID=UPI0033274161
MTGLITGTRNGHLTGRPSDAWHLAFELAPDPGLSDAVCKGIEPEVFFPERGDRVTATLAREICAQCPVAAACLTDALATEGAVGHASRFGIRGGKSPEERHAIYRRSRKVAAVEVASDTGSLIEQRKPRTSPAVDATKGAAA